MHNSGIVEYLYSGIIFTLDFKMLIFNTIIKLNYVLLVDKILIHNQYA